MARRRASRPSRKRSRHTRVGFRAVLLALLAVAVCAVVLYFLAGPYLLPRPRTTQAAARPPKRPAPPAVEQPRKATPPAPSEVPEKGREEPGERPQTLPAPGPLPAPLPGVTARVAVVIDDLGRSLSDLDRLRKLGVPLTYAVLPFETKTAKVVAVLRRRHAEILLHLPMEGRNGANPGPGALMLGMDDAELGRRTLEALAAVPGAVGVNNHMGSSLSADRRAMRAVLGVLAGRGLYFLDSRTTPDTVAYAVAADLGIPAAQRQVFLDPDPRPEAVAYQFRRLLGLARERGSAIAIGHPHPVTLKVLAEEIPKARALGYELVPVSYLLNRSDVVPE